MAKGKKYGDTLDSPTSGKSKKSATNAKSNIRDNKFIFNRSNYVYLIVGVLLNVIGFLFMIGGAAENLNEFNASALFSKMRITFAPILILIGFAIIIYSIMKKPKALKTSSQDGEQ